MGVTMHSRLRQARIEAGFKSARSAALRFGWTVSTYAAHENGQNEFGLESAVIYARAFKVDTLKLIYGQELPREAIDVTCFLPIVGFVGSAGRVSLVGQESDLLIVESHSPVPVSAVAFSIEGTSMWPRYDEGDLIVCLNYFGSSQDFVYQAEEMVVDTGPAEGILLRTVVPGRMDRKFSLKSHNSPDINDIDIFRCWDIWLILPKAKYHLLQDHDPEWSDAHSGGIELMRSMEKSNFENPMNSIWENFFPASRSKKLK